MKKNSLKSAFLQVVSCFLFFVFCFPPSPSIAQDLISKNGTPILPEPGNWSVGFDVIPVFKAVGNLFHTTDSVNLAQEEHTFVALYVKDAHTAYRIRARIGYHSTEFDNKVPDDSYTGTGTAPLLTDSWTENAFNLTLGFGIQKTRGKGRLRGIYGGEIFFMYGSDKNTYNYANPVIATDQMPASTYFDSLSTSGLFTTSQPGSRQSRPVSYNQGNTLGIGVNGFVGAEYFFAPKISVSAEYMWGISYSVTGEGQLSTEQWSAASAADEILVAPTGKSSAFALDVQDAASLILHVYF